MLQYFPKIPKALYNYDHIKYGRDIKVKINIAASSNYRGSSSLRRPDSGLKYAKINLYLHTNYHDHVKYGRAINVKIFFHVISSVDILYILM